MFFLLNSQSGWIHHSLCILWEWRQWLQRGCKGKTKEHIKTFSSISPSLWCVPPTPHSKPSDEPQGISFQSQAPQLAREPDFGHLWFKETLCLLLVIKYTPGISSLVEKPWYCGKKVHTNPIIGRRKMILDKELRVLVHVVEKLFFFEIRTYCICFLLPLKKSFSLSG